MNKIKKIFLTACAGMLLVYMGVTQVSADSSSYSVPYRVNSNPINNVSVTLVANPQNISSGGSSTLTYTPANAVTCVGSGGNFGGSKNTSSNAHNHSTGAITNNTTYSITCTGANGSEATATVTVTVGGAQAASVTLNASPSTIAVGGSSTLSWSSSNTTSCATNGGPWGTNGSLGTSGSQNRSDFSSSGTFHYHIICYGVNGGHATASTTVYAGQQPPGEEGEDGNIGVTLYANGQRSLTVERGSVVTLSWVSTGSPDMCVASWTGTTPRFNTGSEGTAVNSPANFNIDCYKNGAVASSSVFVNTTDPNIGVTLYVNGQRSANVPIGDTVNLSWNSTGGPDMCVASWLSGNQFDSGQSNGVGPIVQNVNFSINCYKNGAVASSSVNVTVFMPQEVTLYVNGKRSDTVTAGDMVNLSWTTAGQIDNCWAYPTGPNWTGTQDFSAYETKYKSGVGPITERTTLGIMCSRLGAYISSSVTIDVKRVVTIIEF